MIEVHELSVILGGRRVLDRVTFTVPPGRLLGLVGPSGSGKSILLKAIAGLLPHHAGEVFLCGQRVTGLEEDALFGVRADVGMLFQGGALFDGLSVFDNVAFPLRRRNVPEPEVAARVTAQLEAVGLAAAAERLPRALSGGMRKRVGVARALVIRPRIGLWDEPVAGLDPVTSARILRLIRRGRDAWGMTGIACGHGVAELLGQMDDAAMLLDGRLVHHGPAEGFGRAAHPAVRQFASGHAEGPL